jgi:hypothetical protein
MYILLIRNRDAGGRKGRPYEPERNDPMPSFVGAGLDPARTRGTT